MTKQEQYDFHNVGNDIANAYDEGFNKGYEAGKRVIAKKIISYLMSIVEKDIEFQRNTLSNREEVPLFYGIIKGEEFVLDELKELKEKYRIEVE